jgi:hypothetical protein
MKIYFYQLLTLSLPFLFLGFGCTSTPSNSTTELSGTLSIRYLNKGQIIRAEAKLFVADSTSQTPYASTKDILFNDQVMSGKWTSEDIYTYQFEANRPYESSAAFNFYDPWQQVKIVELVMDTLPIIQLDTLTLDQDQVKLNLPNLELTEQENITLVFNHPDGETAYLTIDGPSTDSPFIGINTEKLSPGQWLYYSIKRKESFYSDETSNIKLIFEQYSTDNQVIIN